MSFYENPISDDQRYRNAMLDELIKMNRNIEQLLRNNAQVPDVVEPVVKNTTRGGRK